MNLNMGRWQNPGIPSERMRSGNLKVILDCHGFRFQAPRNMVRGDLLVRSVDDCGNRQQENPELVGDGDRLYRLVRNQEASAMRKRQWICPAIHRPCVQFLLERSNGTHEGFTRRSI
jgi:hypothetical protein